MKKAWLMKASEEFEALSQKRGTVELWEDGLRTTGRFGEYEWWYTDLKLEDGTSLVIIFYTAPITAMVKGFTPNITFNLTYPDGTRLEDAAKFEAGECSFATDRCCVTMRGNTIEGDLNTYTIHYESDAVTADVTLKGKTPAWRPETGRISFADKHYFAWLPSVPEGEAEVTLTTGGKTVTLRGTGYHDHNWGDIGMFWLMHHWYWGRAKIGPYQVISSFITARKEYGYEHFPIFMLAKDGELLADNGEYVTYTQTDAVLDPVTGKHVHQTLVYDYNDGKQHYRISYHQEQTIEQFSMTDSKTVEAAKTNAAMRLLLRVAGLAPAYVRVTGTAAVEKLDGDAVVERYESPALWELMYFGKDADV